MIVFGAAATCGFVLYRLLKAMPAAAEERRVRRSNEVWPPLQPRGDEWVEKRPGSGSKRSFGDTEKGQFHGT